jgi:hypothetical protein
MLVRTLHPGVTPLQAAEILLPHKEERSERDTVATSDLGV